MILQHLRITSTNFETFHQPNLTEPWTIVCHKSPNRLVSMNDNTKDLDEQFVKEPEDRVGQLNEPIELSCSPPEGYPPPRILWLKNGLEIEPNRNPDQKPDNNSENLAETVSRSYLIWRPEANGSNGFTSNRNREHKKRITLRSVVQPAYGRRLKMHRYPSDDWARSKTRKSELMLNDAALNRVDDDLTRSFNSSKGRNADNARDSEDYNSDTDRLIRIDERLFTKSDRDANIPKLNDDHSGTADRQSTLAGFVVTSEHSLRISSLRREDAANYTCVAYNASGRRHSRTITLKGIYILTEVLS